MFRVIEADAAVIIANLWDNLVFSLDKEAFCVPPGKGLASSGGKYPMSVQKLIYLAGIRLINKDMQSMILLNED